MKYPRSKTISSHNGVICEWIPQKVRNKSRDVYSKGVSRPNPTISSPVTSFYVKSHKEPATPAFNPKHFFNTHVTDTVPDSNRVKLYVSPNLVVPFACLARALPPHN